MTTQLDRRVFAQLTRQAKLYEAAGARRLQKVLDRHLQFFAQAVASGRDPMRVIAESAAKHRADLRDAQESWVIALAVRGYHLTGIYWGRKASIMGFQGKATASLSVEMFGADELVANHLRARVGAWVDKASKIETRTSSDALERLYRKAFGTAEGDDSMTPAKLAKAIVAEGLTDNDTRAEMMSRTMTVWGFNEGAQEMYRSEGVSAKEWLMTDDDATCFRGHVLVSTRRGEIPIESVAVGDVVRTQDGWGAVVAKSKREYAGAFSYIRTGQSILECTSEHPVFIRGKGFVPAESVRIGDRPNLLNDEKARISCRNQFFLLDSDNGPATGFKKTILPGILGFVFVPVGSVNLDDDTMRRKSKVNAVSSDLRFLDEGKAQSRQGEANGFLDACFSSKFSVAGKAAKAAIRCGYVSKLFPALNAFCYLRRAIALFRTIESDLSTRSAIRKHLSASLTGNCALPDSAAFPRANGETMRETRSNSECFSASRAKFGHKDLFYRCAVALARTIETCAHSGRITIERLSALFTGRGFPVFGGGVIAFPGTEGLLAGGGFKNFTAMRTSVSVKHGATSFSKTYHSAQPFAREIVYNLSIGGDSQTFFANGFLVHNCEECAAMDGTVVDIEGSFVEENLENALLGVEHPPLHPNCRCCLLPVIEPQEAVA